MYDLNIETAVHYEAEVREADVVSACADLSVEAMNRVYFGAEDKLTAVAKRYGGTWFAHEGYQRIGCDLGDPESVRHHSMETSPFTAYFRDFVIPKLLSQDPTIVGLSHYVLSQMLTVFELIRLLRHAGHKAISLSAGIRLAGTRARAGTLKNAYSEFPEDVAAKISDAMPTTGRSALSRPGLGLLHVGALSAENWL